MVTTFAGSTTSGSADGTGAAASFSRPVKVAVDTLGMYVSAVVELNCVMYCRGVFLVLIMISLAACQAMCMLQMLITTKSARSHQQVREGGKSQSSLLVCEH